jgi:hypothetical protein
VILVYISIEYIVLQHLVLLFLLHLVRRRELLKIRNLIKVLGFSTNLCRSSIHKTTNVAHWRGFSGLHVGVVRLLVILNFVMRSQHGIEVARSFVSMFLNPHWLLYKR